MKGYIFLLCIAALLSCSKKRATETFPAALTSDAKWISYEGILPAVNGRSVDVELDLLPAPPGQDSWFKLSQTLYNDSPRFAAGYYFQGTYSVLLGSPGHNIIQINKLQKTGALIYAGYYGKDDLVSDELYLKTNGDHQLILVDENLDEGEQTYLLVRRSNLFTVEGYLTAYTDTSEFFERNTLKTWPVARFGRYDEAINGYNSLAKVEHEGIYVKALSYSIRHVNADGNEVDALVFKNIIRMDSARLVH